MTPEQEKKNRRIGMIISLTTHGLVILLFALLMAWRAPNPPLPEYGIELNFGTDDAGTGDVQPLTPAVESESEEEAAPEEVSSELTEEETPDESSETMESEAIDQVEPLEDEASPDVVEEQENQEEIVDKPEVLEENQTEAETPTDNQPEKTEDEEGAQGVEGETEEVEEVNQGDKADQTGDQGSEEGKLDERALYGKPGGGGGPNLDMAGWAWDFKPAPKDTSNESGKIVFEIKIDDQGEIISIRTIEKTVSISVEQIYKDEVQKLTFSKTDNLPPAPQSVGRITFIIKSN